MAYKDPEEQRRYQRDWLKRRRDKWLAENGPCIDCGSWIDLEVDHIEPAEKAMNPTHVWSLSAEKRELELAKCCARCFGCHKTKTRFEAYKIRQHGTARCYQLERCRCRPCVVAWYRYNSGLIGVGDVMNL